MSMNAGKVFQEVLPNGLKIIGEISLHSKSASVGFFVRTGARDETADEAGLSHFLEHMMFKGTAKRDAIQISYELGSLGAKSNAFTSDENTVYYSSVVSEYFPRMHELLCDMLRPAIDQKEFDTEKKVIQEEIALYQDRPHFYLYDNAIREYFSGHNLGNSVIGTTESVGAITRDQMQSYFDRRYSPANMVLVATGNFSWERFRDDTFAYCRDWKSFEPKRELASFERAPIQRVFKKKGLNQAHLLMMTKGPSVQDDHNGYPLTVLAYILGDSSGSRFYWEIVEKGLAESAVVEVDEKDQAGCLSVWTSLEPENMEQVAQIISTLCSDALQFSDDDLERAKTKLITKIVLGGELPMGRLMALGNEWTYKREIHSLDATVEKIKAVDRASIQAAARNFPFSGFSEFRLIAE